MVGRPGASRRRRDALRITRYSRSLVSHPGLTTDLETWELQQEPDLSIPERSGSPFANLVGHGFVGKGVVDSLIQGSPFFIGESSEAVSQHRGFEPVQVLVDELHGQLLPGELDLIGDPIDDIGHRGSFAAQAPSGFGERRCDLSGGLLGIDLGLAAVGPADLHLGEPLGVAFDGVTAVREADDGVVIALERPREDLGQSGRNGGEGNLVAPPGAEKLEVPR